MDSEDFDQANILLVVSCGGSYNKVQFVSKLSKFVSVCKNNDSEIFMRTGNTCLHTMIQKRRACLHTVTQKRRACSDTANTERLW